MLLSSHIFLLATATATLFISSSISTPVHYQQQQKSFQISSNTNKEVASLIPLIPSSSYLENYNIITDLDDYYSTIVNQIVESTINEIIETAPETFLTLHQLQLIGRDYCQTSIVTFMQVLEYQLNNQVKNNLLTSVRPLIDYHYKTKGQSILDLNKVISKQLGLILNSNQLSNNIIQEIYQKQKGSGIVIQFWKLLDKKWIKTLHHEKNESIALQAWLNSWLMDIELILKDEFDSHVTTLL